MKAILLSIKPKHIANILNGEKTIEIRKTMPKCDLPITVYIYCTKGKPRAILTDKGCILANKLVVDGNSQYKSGYALDGQVVAKFKLKKIEKIQVGFDEDSWEHYYFITEKELTEKACVSSNELNNYLKGENGYAYLVEDLVIFDIPKELSEFHKIGYKNRLERELSFSGDIGGLVKDIVDYWYQIKKAPQSYCYVEIEEDKNDID